MNRKQKKAKSGSVRYMSLETSDVENQKDPGRWPLGLNKHE